MEYAKSCEQSIQNHWNVMGCKKKETRFGWRTYHESGGWILFVSMKLNYDMDQTGDVNVWIGVDINNQEVILMWVFICLTNSN